MLSVLTMSTITEKDIHVVSMDVEAIAVIKKNSKKESLLIKSQVFFEENFKNPI